MPAQNDKPEEQSTESDAVGPLNLGGPPVEHPDGGESPVQPEGALARPVISVRESWVAHVIDARRGGTRSVPVSYKARTSQLVDGQAGERLAAPAPDQQRRHRGSGKLKSKASDVATKPLFVDIAKLELEVRHPARELARSLPPARPAASQPALPPTSITVVASAQAK